MNFWSIIAIVVAIVFGFFLALELRRLRRLTESSRDDTGFKLLLEQMNELTRTVDRKISDTTKQVGEAMRGQFSESAKLIREVTTGLTKLDETNKQVISFADQLQSLQDILKNPKQRGVLGEYYLETLLKNVLPPGSFQMQYEFPDGTIVDAAVFVKDK
ncbi:MAG: DNA recombination protein RmuC, partial [Patescibacteria group bacterium]